MGTIVALADESQSSAYCEHEIENGSRVLARILPIRPIRAGSGDQNGFWRQGRDLWWLEDREYRNATAIFQDGIRRYDVSVTWKNAQDERASDAPAPANGVRIVRVEELKNRDDVSVARPNRGGWRLPAWMGAIRPWKAAGIVAAGANKFDLYFLRVRNRPNELFRATCEIEQVWLGEEFDEPGLAWLATWKLESTAIKVPFSGKFGICRVGDAAYLLPGEGGLYVRDTTIDATQATLKQIKLRNGAVVQSVIYDADRDNRAFAFTSNYWFEVKEPIEYREFELGSITPDDPMPMLVRCAREVRKHFPAVVPPERPADAK